MAIEKRVDTREARFTRQPGLHKQTDHAHSLAFEERQSNKLLLLLLLTGHSLRA
jgi:hypothetical protein